MYQPRSSSLPVSETSTSSFAICSTDRSLIDSSEIPSRFSSRPVAPGQRSRTHRPRLLRLFERHGGPHPRRQRRSIRTGVALEPLGEHAPARATCSTGAAPSRGEHSCREGYSGRTSRRRSLAPSGHYAETRASSGTIIGRRLPTRSGGREMVQPSPWALSHIDKELLEPRGIQPARGWVRGGCPWLSQVDRRLCEKTRGGAHLDRSSTHCAHTRRPRRPFPSWYAARNTRGRVSRKSRRS